MPTLDGVTFEIPDTPRQHLTGTHERTRWTGVLLLTDRRFLFGRPIVRRGLFSTKPGAELAFELALDAIASVEYHRSVVALRLRDGTVERVVLAAEPADLSPILNMVMAVRPRDDFRRRTREPRRTIGVVTEWICRACTEDCRCPSPLLVPAALAGWSFVFGFPGWTEPAHVFDGVADTPVRREDIVEIAYLAEGRGDGPPWLVIARLRDDRWAYVSHTIQITGDVWTTTAVAASLDRLWWGACTEDDRSRLTPDISPAECEEELVRLDAMMQSDDAEVRHYAAARSLQLQRLNARP